MLVTYPMDATPLPVAPTRALDLALEALAHNDPETCLRHAIPALEDEGAGAPAADLVGRAMVTLGAMAAARGAFETAARALAVQGMASHAIAAALAVAKLSGSDVLLRELACVFGSESPRTAQASVAPPPLASVAVRPLDGAIPRAELIALARRGVDLLSARTATDLPVRSRHGLWGTLPPGAFERFAMALDVRVSPAGERVLTEGEPGQCVYLVARGEVRVTRGPDDDPVDLAVLGAESVFGEMALLTDAPRAASAVTSSPTLLLQASRAALETAWTEVPALGAELSAWGRRRLVANLLHTSHLLRELPANTRAALSDVFDSVRYEPGDVLVTQDMPSQGLHVIATGRVKVHRRDAQGEDLLVATVGPGGCVGEVSLVLRRPATATVTAVTPTVSLVLHPDDFMAVVHKSPALLASLYALAVERTEELTSVVAQEATDADDLVIV